MHNQQRAAKIATLAALWSAAFGLAALTKPNPAAFLALGMILAPLSLLLWSVDIADRAREVAPAASDPARINAWLAREHDVFRDGEIVGRVRISDDAARAVLELGVSAYVNLAATEPRWEAVCGKALAIADDPNVAIMECASKL